MPSPLFAAKESTSGYKTTSTCSSYNSAASVSLMKKEDSNSKKWGVYTCITGSCSWANKAVSYDTAKDKYNKKANNTPCTSGTLSIKWK